MKVDSRVLQTEIIVVDKIVEQIIENSIDPSVEMMEILGKILDLLKLNLTKELQENTELVKVENKMAIMTLNNKEVVLIVEILLPLINTII